jgi:hypothetical protein
VDENRKIDGEPFKMLHNHDGLLPWWLSSFSDREWERVGIPVLDATQNPFILP